MTGNAVVLNNFPSQGYIETFWYPQVQDGHVNLWSKRIQHSENFDFLIKFTRKFPVQAYPERVLESVTNVLFIYEHPGRACVNFFYIPTNTNILLPPSQKRTPSLRPCARTFLRVFKKIKNTKGIVYLRIRIEI